jgi:hypothetical protein
VRIQLMEGTNYITIADNWERMIVVVNGHQLTIYDLGSLINNGGLDAGAIATLTFERWINSAMFFGRELNSILVTDYTNKVMTWEYDHNAKIWCQREIFRGDYPVTYAETNGDGRQLLIIESVSSGCEYKWIIIFARNRREMVRFGERLQVVRRNFLKRNRSRRLKALVVDECLSNTPV